MEATLLVLARAPSPEDALELDARRRIAEVVAATPGIHFSDVVRALDYAPTTVRYHLGVLEREGVLSSLEVGRYLRYYPRERGEHLRREALSADEKRILAMLRQRVPLAVAIEILVRGPTTHAPLAAAIGVSPSTLTHHLQKMAASGVVVLQREGRETRISLAAPDRVRALVARYAPKPDLADALVDLFEDVGF